MKRINFLNYLAAIALSLIVVTACKKDKTETKETPKKIVPTTMTVDVPSSISAQNLSKSAKGNELKGDDIYRSLRGFVWIGANGAKIINGLCYIVQAYDLTKVTTVTFTGGDGKLKTLTMTQNPTIGGATWEWEMQVTDYDGSKALQFYWNVSPVKGVAIFQASKLNHTDIFSAIHANAIIKIEYSEAEANYSKQMIVTIDSLTLIHTNDPNKIKMFVGKRTSDGLLDVWGNSNSPNAKIYDQSHTGGYQWAFVAHADQDVDIAVAKVSLPPCNYLKSDTSLWGTYSIYNVLHKELTDLGANQATVDEYVKNAKAPGYFMKGTGFLSCGPVAPTTPSGFTTTFCDLSALFPYVPNEIKTLKVVFN
jgi:hypothetical protein